MTLPRLAFLSITICMLAAAAIAADAVKTTGAAKNDYFATVDTNNDGFISRDEWRAHGDKIFDAMDANHDGKISRDEMKAYYAAKDASRKARHDAWVAEHAKPTDASAKAPASK